MFKALFYILLLLPVAGWAEDISILGLFKDRVVLQVDGKPSVLKVGQKTPQGFKLLQATSKEAVFLVDGKKQSFQLGMQIQSSFNVPQIATVHIARDPHGMYRVEGRVNKIPVHFLVDTGASMLSLSSDQADAMKLSYKEGEPTTVETAGGEMQAYKITVASVTVGAITLRDVPTLIVSGGAPKEALLGMSFLNRLSIQENASVMQLDLKY